MSVGDIRKRHDTEIMFMDKVTAYNHCREDVNELISIIGKQGQTIYEFHEGVRLALYELSHLRKHFNLDEISWTARQFKQIKDVLEKSIEEGDKG